MPIPGSFQYRDPGTVAAAQAVAGSSSIGSKILIRKSVLKKKMLENRPEDALGSLVKTVETVKTERGILKYLTR